MSIYVVTGGTGFLGESVVRELCSDPANTVKVLARSASSSLDGVNAEFVRADIMEGPELAEAMRGCDGVFHLAGFVSRDPEDGQRMMRVHVEGTRRVLEEAVAAGVPRVVIASSSGTIAVSADEVVHDESYGYAEEVACGWPYYASKIYQEKLALELADKLGIEVVIVNPSLLLGPGDSRLSSTKDVLRFLRKQIPVVPEGGVNFVDVRDAAKATVAAMSKGRAGERYLLGGPNWSTKEFFGRLQRVAKVGRPRIKLPAKWAEFGASVVEHVYRSRGAEPPVDRISVEMANHFWWLDSSKAERELGFEARDPSLTLADTVKYLRQDIDPNV